MSIIPQKDVKELCGRLHDVREKLAEMQGDASRYTYNPTASYFAPLLDAVREEQDANPTKEQQELLDFLRAGKPEEMTWDEWEDKEAELRGKSFAAQRAHREEITNRLTTKFASQLKQFNELIQERDALVEEIRGKFGLENGMGLYRSKGGQKRRDLAREIYDSVLRNEYNDVLLQQINDYIDEAAPDNPYGRRISQRLPQKVERKMYERHRTNAVDALYTRIAESAVGSSGKKLAGNRSKREREQKRKRKKSSSSGQ